MVEEVIIPQRNWDEFMSWLRSANLPTTLVYPRDEDAREFVRRVGKLIREQKARANIQAEDTTTKHEDDECPRDRAS